MPTTFCLISLVEKPFLVITLKEIELVSIERIDNKIRNFDLVVIFKNYSKPVKILKNIPKEYLNMLKEWLDNENILYLEGGTINLKWDNVMKKIRDNP